MNTTYTTGDPDVHARVDQAAVRLYDAECALHFARQTRVDNWISAAADHLRLQASDTNDPQRDVAALALRELWSLHARSAEE